MPTFQTTPRFDRDLKKLTREQRAALSSAIANLVADLKTAEIGRHGPRFRRNLRVKELSGFKGIFEMSWARDGRATFEYGPTQRERQMHLIWRRVGTHDIFRRP